MNSRRLAAFVVVAALSASLLPAQTASKITTPKEQLGFNIGDDYHVANYTQLEAYWKKLATESPRMKLESIGKTEEGREQWMAIVTSPENMKKLARYKEIAGKLAHAEGVSEPEARALAREGKAIVWIDGGLHATETVGSQQLMEWVYQMVSRNDEETLRFLNDTIVLNVQANPDGQELVADWYMREKDPLKRTMSGLPRLYAKYVGHDDNRDFYMSNMKETTNMNRQLFIEWFPQMMYNHHQTGPAGAVVFIPPFRDPFNYNFHPLVPLGIEMVGTAMHSRLVAEGKGGSAMRTGANYSTWWNGGLRTVTYFHNMIGILTEIIGNPTPMRIPVIADKQLPQGDWPLPVVPQEWHYRQSIEYEITQNRAMVDLASRYRETWLFNIWQMGANSIRNGSQDHWTVTPKRIAALEAAAAAGGPTGATAGRGGRGGRGGAATVASPAGGDVPAGGGSFGGTTRAIPAELYDSVLHDPNLRDPRGYIIPSDQADFATATAFINALIKNGIAIHRATAAFQVAGKTYPAGSFVVKAAQAFRPHVMDMFEPQDHPNDFAYPGGPPKRPYDITGWTLAMQMGVRYERVFDGFDGPFAKVNGLQPPPAMSIVGPANPAGYLISHRINNSFTLLNRLMKAGGEAYWLKSAGKVDGEDLGTGAIWVPYSAAARPVLEKSAKELGVTVHAVAKAPGGEAMKLKPVRIGLYDQYGGSMPSGWTRWLFEQFEFPFEVVYPQTLDAGNLKSRFDVLVFTDGAIRRGNAGGRGGGGGGTADAGSVPAEFQPMLGRISDEKTIPALKQFVESGGSVVTIGSSTSVAEVFGIPVRNHLVEKGADGRDRSLPAEKFYIPGSLLKAQLDNTNPLAYGMDSEVTVFYDNSPVFRLEPTAAIKKTHAVGWFSGDALQSGWAWGQQYLDGGAAFAEATVGEGKVYLLGPEVNFRDQPHGTFKLLFNSLYSGSAKETALP
ncbi:MAG: M14 metallopeptidase family protein [Candidatus Solibacter sp.]